MNWLFSAICLGLSHLLISITSYMASLCPAWLPVSQSFCRQSECYLPWPLALLLTLRVYYLPWTLTPFLAIQVCYLPWPLTLSWLSEFSCQTWPLSCTFTTVSSTSPILWILGTVYLPVPDLLPGTFLSLSLWSWAWCTWGSLPRVRTQKSP